MMVSEGLFLANLDVKNVRLTSQTVLQRSHKEGT